MPTDDRTPWQERVRPPRWMVLMLCGAALAILGKPAWLHLPGHSDYPRVGSAIWGAYAGMVVEAILRNFPWSRSSPPRFSLRRLLIVMTLVATGLGMVAYLMR
jgi:hypothetical protein